MRRVFVFEYVTAGAAADPALLPLLAQGRAMRDALAVDLVAGGFDVTVATAGLPVPPRTKALPVAAAASPFDVVGRAAPKHDVVWVIAPETGGLLGRLCRAVPAARWIGCTPAAIGVASSKQATLARLSAHGVATPLDFVDGATRWVVKPDDGAGAAGMRVHADVEAARAAMRAIGLAGALTLEPWVDGDALSLSLLCAGGEAELLAVNRQRIDVAPDGVVGYRGVDRIAAAAPLRGQLALLASKVAAALAGLRGYVGVDLVAHPRRGPVVVEVNPRLTCAYVGLSAALGRNVAAAVLARHALEPAHAVA